MMRDSMEIMENLAATARGSAIEQRKALVNLEYIGTLCTTGHGTLGIGNRYLDEILTKLLADKDPFKPFAGRVRLIVEEFSMSRGIPEEPEKEDEDK